MTHDHEIQMLRKTICGNSLSLDNAQLLLQYNNQLPWNPIHADDSSIISFHPEKLIKKQLSKNAHLSLKSIYNCWNL